MSNLDAALHIMRHITPQKVEQCMADLLRDLDRCTVTDGTPKAQCEQKCDDGPSQRLHKHSGHNMSGHPSRVLRKQGSEPEREPAQAAHGDGTQTPQGDLVQQLLAQMGKRLEELDGDVRGVRLAGDQALAQLSDGMGKRLEELVGDVKGVRAAGDQALAQLSDGMGKRFEQLDGEVKGVRAAGDQALAQLSDGMGKRFEQLAGEVKSVRAAGDQALTQLSDGLGKRFEELDGDVKGVSLAVDQALAQRTDGMGQRMEELVRLDADRLMALFTDGLAALERRVEASLVELRTSTVDLVVKSMVV